MATKYKLMAMGFATVDDQTVRLTVGVFPDTVDPTQTNADGSLANEPLTSLFVTGRVTLDEATWRARATDAFTSWCHKAAAMNQAKALYQAQANTVLELDDPTGN